MCETVKDEALALIDNTRHISQCGDAADDEDSMETDCPRSSQKDQRDGVSRGQNDGHVDDLIVDALFPGSQFYVQANEPNLTSIIQNDIYIYTLPK